MKRFARTAMIVLTFALAIGVAPGGDRQVQACPGCKTANETDNLRPQAYMYSILFMLGMPATVFTGFGIAFYRMSRKATLEQQLAEEAESATSTTAQN